MEGGVAMRTYPRAVRYGRRQRKLLFRLDWRRAPWGRGVGRYPLPVALCVTLSVLIGSEGGFPHLLLLVPWPHLSSAFVLGLFDGANWFCGRIPLGSYTVARALYVVPRYGWSQAHASVSVVGLRPPIPSALTSVLGSWPPTFWPWGARLVRSIV